MTIFRSKVKRSPTLMIELTLERGFELDRLHILFHPLYISLCGESEEWLVKVIGLLHQPINIKLSVVEPLDCFRLEIF